jgi:hypothetical protein
VSWLNKIGDPAFWQRKLDLLKEDPFLMAVIVVGAVIGWLVRKLWEQRQINILKATNENQQILLDMSERDRAKAESDLREMRIELAQAKKTALPEAKPALEALEATAIRAVFSAQEARRLFYEEYGKVNARIASSGSQK